MKNRLTESQWQVLLLVVLAIVFIAQYIAITEYYIPSHLADFEKHETIHNYLSDSMYGLWKLMLFWPACLLGAVLGGIFKSRKQDASKNNDS